MYKKGAFLEHLKKILMKITELTGKHTTTNKQDSPGSFWTSRIGCCAEILSFVTLPGWRNAEKSTRISGLRIDLVVTASGPPQLWFGETFSDATEFYGISHFHFLVVGFDGDSRWSRPSSTLIKNNSNCRTESNELRYLNNFSSLIGISFVWDTSAPS